MPVPETSAQDGCCITSCGAHAADNCCQVHLGTGTSELKAATGAGQVQQENWK
jgi:hypothetical protein